MAIPRQVFAAFLSESFIRCTALTSVVRLVVRVMSEDERPEMYSVVARGRVWRFFCL